MCFHGPDVCAKRRVLSKGATSFLQFISDCPVGSGLTRGALPLLIASCRTLLSSVPFAFYVVCTSFALLISTMQGFNLRMLARTSEPLPGAAPEGAQSSFDLSSKTKQTNSFGHSGSAGCMGRRRACWLFAWRADSLLSYLDAFRICSATSSAAYSVGYVICVR